MHHWAGQAEDEVFISFYMLIGAARVLIDRNITIHNRIFVGQIEAAVYDMKI